MMKPSVTYLHLLRHKPFFIGFTKDRLRWTIDHSREWEADAGTVVSTCDASASDHLDTWILLDGRWQVEAGVRSYPAGHADPGKWFSGGATRGACRLVTTEHSYVMKIRHADMEEMLARGFSFKDHLEEGRTYYDDAFSRQSDN
ncbi:hypothetical protein [Paraburkholderia unamae]|nr:hypothetical protein [Paraburkholderia unamae]